MKSDEHDQLATIKTSCSATLINVLPSAAFLSFLVDAQLSPLLPAVFTKLPPVAVLILALWIIATISTAGRNLLVTRSMVILTGCSAIWFAATTLLSVTLVISLRWDVAVIIGFMLPATLSRGVNYKTRIYLHNTLIGAGLVLGVLGVVEGFLKRSFIYADSANSLGEPGSQHWSEYRAYLVFNHPLVAGTVLASLSVYALFTYVGGGNSEHPRAAAWTAVFAGFATISTVSRSSVFALVATFIIASLIIFVKRDRSSKKVLALFLPAAAMAGYVILLSPIATRSQSTEGEDSALFRSSVFDLVGPLSRPYDYLGSGPGTSQQWAYSTGYHRLLENSPLQIFISTGIVGSVLLASFLVIALLQALRDRKFASFATILSLSFSSLAFGVLETYPVIFVLFGAYAIMASRHREFGSSACRRQQLTRSLRPVGV